MQAAVTLQVRVKRARASRRGGAQACIYLQVRCREGVTRDIIGA